MSPLATTSGTWATSSRHCFCFSHRGCQTWRSATTVSSPYGAPASRKKRRCRREPGKDRHNSHLITYLRQQDHFPHCNCNHFPIFPRWMLRQRYQGARTLALIRLQHHKYNSKVRRALLQSPAALRAHPEGLRTRQRWPVEAACPGLFGKCEFECQRGVRFFRVTVRARRVVD